MSDSVNEIKSRLSIVDVVQRYVALKKAGRNFKGLCPFHSDHTPSLVVSPEKGLAWCFSCQSGGDIFSFVQKIENVDFPEALKILADIAGVELHPVSGEKTSIAREKKLVLMDLLEKALQYFGTNLQKAKPAQEYLEKRGLTPEIIEKFELGYAFDDYHGLEQHLSSLGFSRKEMLEAGVVSTKDDKGQEVYDRFRKRLIFPIWDANRGVRGFGGRIIGDGEPKYLNSPETALYDKSEILYGLNFAKEAIKKAGYCVLVEGYMDVISCHQAGIENVVATCGTALTTQHVKLLQRFTNEIVLAFDADQAGQDATSRAIEIGLQSGANLSVLSIPGGKDPDEAIQSNPKAFEESLLQRTAVIDFLLERAFRGKNPENAQDERRILDELFPFLVLLPKAFERDRYLKNLLNRFQMIGSSRQSGEILRREFVEFEKNFLRQNQKNAFQNTAHSVQSDKKMQKISALWYLLGMISTFPELLPLAKKNLLIDLLPDGGEKRFYRVFCEAYNPAGVLDPETIAASDFSPSEKEEWQLASLYAETKNDQLAPELRTKEFQQIIRSINSTLISKELRRIDQELKKLSPDATEEKALLKKRYIDFARLLTQL